MEYLFMFSTVLYAKYVKSDFGQTINFNAKTPFEKTKFILVFSFTGIIKVISYDFFIRIVKPPLMIIAYLFQTLTLGKFKFLVAMKRSMDKFIFQLFGCDE
jgi:hypothetical protein